MRQDSFETFVTEQNDIVDNAVYHMMLEILGETEETFRWDMAVIGEVAEAVGESLQLLGMPICHPFWENEIPCCELEKDSEGCFLCGRLECPAIVCNDTK